MLHALSPSGSLIEILKLAERKAHTITVLSNDTFDSQATNAVFHLHSHRPKAQITLGVGATHTAEI